MCGVTFPNRSYYIRRTASTVSCLETVLSGSGTVRLDGREYRLMAGDSYLLPEGHDHEYFSDKNNPWKKVWVNFSGDFSLSLLKLWGLDGNNIFHGLDLSDLLYRMQGYCNGIDTASAYERCTGIMAEAFTRISCSLRSAGDVYLSPAHILRMYIDRHITEPLVTTQLADYIGKSESQAQRLFHAEYGTSLYKYILEQKLSLACQLLRETGLTVREIANYLSFEDEFYFSGLFRRKIGISPSKYRENEIKK